ncbi:MAG: sugar ABC transporter ATP-binding protein [Thermaceae bacterium]|nr:sugar ABC transporter ATP-binding protein [Thermaceae bacterium]
MAAKTPLLQLEGLEKRFGGIQALRGVSFDLRPGEIHALLGENGAGKSTLIKILSGAYRPDSGRIVLEGVETTFASPRQAQAAGIATIYQETSLYPDLSVLENLFMGHQPMRGGRINWVQMNVRAKELLERLGMELPLRARLGDLGKARAQLVEIAKALLQQARILILDEPTAALTTRDAERLMEVVRGLRAQGVAMIYITHRLEEVFALADRVTVLRDGEVAGSAQAGGFDSNWLISRMVGRAAGQLFPRNPRPQGKPLLEVRGLSGAGLLKEVSFTVHEGEIVGLAGLVGSGRTEVARAIFGLDRREGGEILLEGKPVPPNPQAAIERGVAMLPEDRGRQGLILPFSLGKNMTLPLLRLGGWLDRGLEEQVFQEFSRKLDIRPPLASLAASALSGGNQQKVVIAKWLATRPKVLILDEPTQGVDVGAKAEIHRLMDDLVSQGLGILMISSELVEVLGMADRILVMHRGRLVAELPRGSSQEDVMRAATGSIAAEVPA